MVRLKIVSPNKVPATEVLVDSENVASWVWLNPLIGSRRVGLFLSEPVSWIYTWICKEAIEVIMFRTLESAIHSIVID